uniref:SH3 domain-containing protein n=1 Tax=Ditylenchus dipsaci TaxID=166011 RepID=A0A915CZE5_9BILA
MMVNQSLLLLQPPLNLGANSLTPEQHSSTLSSSSSSPLDGDASASSTSSSMLVAGVRVRLGTTGLEKNYEDRLHPTSSSLTTEPESELAGCLTGTGTDPAKSHCGIVKCTSSCTVWMMRTTIKAAKTNQCSNITSKRTAENVWAQIPKTDHPHLASGVEQPEKCCLIQLVRCARVRRSKSQPRQPYRYDPVADMEILDRWKWQQQNQKHSTSNHSLNNVTKPKTSIQFEEDYNGGSERSTAKPCVSFQECADSLPPKPPRSSHASVHPHLHLPPYRLADQKRCLCFNLPCTSLTPFRHCREHTQEQIDQLYKLVGPANMDVYCKQEKLYEKLKLRHMEERMDKTTKELDALLGQIERFSKFAGQRSKSSVAISRRPSNHLNGLHSSREEGSVSSVLTSKDNLLQKQKIDKLCEELEDQLARKHGYLLASSTPSLQNNFDRFDHLMHSFAVGNRSRSGSETPMSNTSSRPVQTCTTLYTFVSQSPRELSLNKGDVVRLNRQLDDNWWEGERNGQVGIFPASYVQLDESTSKDRLKAIYAFRARNPNELSLNRGDTLEYLRSIDQHWLEGRNSKGQVGIFPRSYVQKEDSKSGEKPFKSSISFAVEGEVNGTPDRPKTPKIIVGNSNGGRWVVQTFNLSKVLHF